MFEMLLLGDSEGTFVVRSESETVVGRPGADRVFGGWFLPALNIDNFQTF